MEEVTDSMAYSIDSVEGSKKKEEEWVCVDGMKWKDGRWGKVGCIFRV